MATPQHEIATSPEATTSTTHAGPRQEVATGVRISPGHKQRKRNKHGRQRKPAVLRFYNHKGKPVDTFDQDYYIQLIRPGKLGNMRLDNQATTITWSEDPDDVVIRGSLTIENTDPALEKNPSIHDGHKLKIWVKTAGKWTELWRARIMVPESSPTLSSESRSFDLADDSDILQESIDDFHWKASAHHKPHGWTCDEITIEVAKRYRVPLGKISQGTHKIKNLSMQDASPLAVIRKAYALEKQHTGKKFVIRWTKGRLNITPLRRNPTLYVLNMLIEAAEVGRQARGDKFATAVTVFGSGGKGKKKGDPQKTGDSGGGDSGSGDSGKKPGVKIRKLVVNEAAVKRYGYIHKKIHPGNVTSTDDAETKGKRYIAKHSTRKKTGSVQHPLLPFVRKGDAIWVNLPEDGFKGKKAIVYVTRIEKTLEAGNFDMQVDFNRIDPYKPTKVKNEEEDKEDRDKKAPQHAQASGSEAED